MPLHSCSNNEFNNSRVPRVPGTIFPTLGTRFCYALTLPSKIDIGALLLASSHLAYSQGKFPVSSYWPYWTIYIFRYSSFFLFFFFFTLSLLRRYVRFQLPWYGNKRVLVLIRGSERYRWIEKILIACLTRVSKSNLSMLNNFVPTIVIKELGKKRKKDDFSMNDIFMKKFFQSDKIVRSWDTRFQWD